MKHLIKYLFLVLGLVLSSNLSFAKDKISVILICPQSGGNSFHVEKTNENSLQTPAYKYRRNWCIYKVHQLQDNILFHKVWTHIKHQNSGKIYKNQLTKLKKEYDFNNIWSAKKRITIYKASTYYWVLNKTYFGESTVSMDVAKKNALSKCPGYTDCKIVQTEIITDGIKEPDVKSAKKQRDLEKEKKKIAEEKRKIAEEKRKIAEAKRKQEEEERRILEAKKKEEESKRKKSDEKLYVIGTGTGFFVSSAGHVVSNEHVVGICKQVASKLEGNVEYFNILSTDNVNDLGLLKGNYRTKNFLSIKTSGAEFGEDIVAFGYPLSESLSTSVKLTRGIVSSLSGPGNNYSQIQIDAAIQPGNSGGPVLNMEGQVVGVASSGLNKIKMLKKSEYIPENVNFAVAATTLSNFLKANGVPIRSTQYKISNTKELAKLGRPATLQLFCMNTKGAYKKLIEQQKHSDVLLEKAIELK